MKQRSNDWALGCSTFEWLTDSFRVCTIYLKMQKCSRNRWQVHHQGRKCWKHKNCTSKSRHQLQKIRVWAVSGCCAATTETGARRIPKGEEAHGRSFSISKTCMNLFINPWSMQNLSMCCKLTNCLSFTFDFILSWQSDNFAILFWQFCKIWSLRDQRPLWRIDLVKFNSPWRRRGSDGPCQKKKKAGFRANWPHGYRNWLRT